jgi:hypothetical protein
MSDIHTPKPVPPTRWGHKIEPPKKVEPSLPSAASEVSRNLLTVVGNKHNDPVVIARAVEQLQRFRGDPAVDSYFAHIKYLREQEDLKRRIKALAQHPIKIIE